MALATLTQIKSHLGITGSSEDTALQQWLAQVSNAIRAYLGLYLGGQITSASVANPTIITCPGHGLETSDVIVIAHSGTTPTINGSQTVTRVTDDTFSIPINVTVAGTAGLGTFARTYTEFYEGTGDRLFGLNQRPVHSIGSLYLDNGAAYGEETDSFGSSTLLTAGTDYNLVRDFAGHQTLKSKSGLVAKIGGVWTRPGQVDAGYLVGQPGLSNGNIKVTYTAGYTTIPQDLVLAVCNLVGEARRTASTGGAAIQSESFDYYSYSLASVTEAIESMSSVKSILARYKPVRI